MNEAARPVLRAIGLGRHFDDGQRVIHVLRGLELSVRERESIAVVGESGVGKSTLLHILGALDRPDAGDVELDGESLFSMSPADLAKVRCRSLGFVFQFHHLLGDFDAVENVMLPLLIAQEHRASARKRAAETLSRVGLSDRLRHRPGQLSGGEQQRVAVARAVVGRPRVVLADEPTGNLDPTTAGEVQSLLLELQKEQGCSLLIATHSRTLAAAMDRTLRLADGVLRPEGP
jgi:lipoprotein-releasing system ATP-binding protein